MYSNALPELRRVLVAGLALSVIAGVPGCKSADRSSADRAAPASESKAAPMDEEYGAAGGEAVEEEEGFARSTMADQAVQGPAGRDVDNAHNAQKPPEPRPDRMIVYEAWLTVSTHEVQAALDQAENLVESSGGYVESSTRESRVLRIPSARYHQVLEQLKGLGDVERLQQRSQDVTERFTNLVARIENLEAMQARYRELLQQATQLKDRIAIERELRRISKELEQLRARRRAMKNMADFATVELTVQRKQTNVVAQRDRHAQPFGWVRSYGLTGVLR